MRLLALAFLLAFAGCGGGLIPIKTAKVSGTAHFDGKPLENYRVFFFCEAAKAQEPSTALVQKDGSFTVTTRVAGDGAIVGSNQVWLIYDPPAPELEAGKEVPWSPPPPTIKIPAKFLDKQTSGLVVEVPDAGLTDYKLELK